MVQSNVSLPSAIWSTLYLVGWSVNKIFPPDRCSGLLFAVLCSSLYHGPTVW